MGGAQNTRIDDEPRGLRRDFPRVLFVDHIRDLADVLVLVIEDVVSTEGRHALDVGWLFVPRILVRGVRGVTHHDLLLGPALLWYHTDPGPTHAVRGS